MDVDLNLLDIKSGDPAVYEKVTRQPLQPTLDYARRLSALGRPMWIRYVLVPGSHRRLRQRREGGRILRRAQVGRGAVEILRFHQMGKRQMAQARPRIPAGEFETRAPS